MVTVAELAMKTAKEAATIKLLGLLIEDTENMTDAQAIKDLLRKKWSEANHQI